MDVSDTGVGIPAAELERVFEPFEQVRGHERYIGHGLGLAITRQLVELMGGSIALESDLGRGTRVAVRLPLVPTAAPAPVDGALERSARASAAAVLVVDDNEINLRVAAALVRRAGFQVQLARDGREALRAVETQPFALVLMDCHMPEMDGFEATRCIRLLNSPARTTPIIAVTANALPEERERCLAAGMNACATKPLTLADLERAFGEALSA
ncbi:MAG: response regulator [Myxococcota bacterium]